jgi:transcriptional regulator with PAS, ATPase and Fis domain
MEHEMERNRDARSSPGTPTSDKIFVSLIALCDDLAHGRAVDDKKLYALTNENTVPPDMARLAEAFGMMLVKLETRMEHRERLIAELKKTNHELTKAQDLLSKRYQQLNQAVLETYHPRQLLGNSPAIQKIAGIAIQIAHRPINTMILGATGSGKEVVAKMIHYNSARREQNFIAVNCSAIPEGLFESEMFGIEKGVATGVGQRQGLLETANGGTIFLDELADMSLANQAKLLRVLQDGELRRVGGSKAVKIDVLVISATSLFIEQAIAEKRFRADLYYRLNVAEIRLPPLAERGEDVLILARHFLGQHTQRLMRAPLDITPAAQKMLLAYGWPGNVRELSNEMERLAALVNGVEVVESDLSPRIRARPAHGALLTTESAPVLTVAANGGGEAGAEPGEENDDNDEGGIARASRRAISNALQSSHGNKSRAAEILGISREGLRKKLKKLGMAE